MHALQFIKAFADYTGQDYASLRVIDRALMVADLRGKSKGRRLPDVTLDEGMMFLLAVLANAQPTRAAEAARDIAKFQILQSRVGRSSIAMLARIFRRPVAQVLTMDLFDVMIALCRGLPKVPETGRWVELTVQRGGAAFLSIGRDMDDFGPDKGFGQIEFVGSLATRMTKVLTETRTAMPPLLRWIAENTTRNPEASNTETAT